MKHLELEEEFHDKDRKYFRKERKKIQRLDRSKYKKTDLPSSEKTPQKKDHLLQGRVVRITGEGSLVAYQNKEYLCSLKGFLKKEKNLYKNLIAVGDYVYFSPSSQNTGAIAQVLPRTSFLSRTDISGKKEQLIAVNIDYAVICASVVEPSLKPSLIDRYIIAARKGNLIPILVINKIDLLETSFEEQVLLDEFLAVYEPLGLPIFLVSTKTNQGIEELKKMLKDHTSVFSGQSGVGKSSLLNTCFQMNLKTGKLTTKTVKGAHTTTRAELIALPEGGYCVDTPGIRSFGIWKLKPEEVRAYFTDIAEIGKGCKFPNCLHKEEPECKVKEAIDHEKISRLRYESYYTLLEEALSESDKKTWG